MTTFSLVRHGQADWRWTEHTGLTGFLRDFTPLTAFGHGQISATASDLRAVNAELILSSPYTRSLESGAILARMLNVPLKVEFDLREWMPDTDGQIESLEAVFAAARAFEACDGCPPDKTHRWESRADLQARVMRVLERYLHLERVIVTTHEMVIWSITGQRDVANGEVVTFEWSNANSS